MASMLIQAATVVLTTVGVPTGAAVAVATVGVNLAITAATNFAADALTDPPRAESPGPAFLPDPVSST